MLLKSCSVFRMFPSSASNGVDTIGFSVENHEDTYRESSEICSWARDIVDQRGLWNAEGRKGPGPPERPPGTWTWRRVLRTISASWKIENAKIVKPISRKIQKNLRPRNFANTLRESYLIVIAYANALSRPYYDFDTRCLHVATENGSGDIIKRSDSKEVIAESESTHLEI